MKHKLTAIHGVIIIFIIILIAAVSMLYVITDKSEYESINASDVNDSIGKKVKVKLTPIEEIEIPSIDGYKYLCEENNIVISSNETLELDKTITVYGKVKENEKRIILFIE